MDSLEQRLNLAAISWDGGAGTLNWSDAANWSGDVLPTSADDVTIDLPNSDPEVRLSSTTSVKSVRVADGLRITAGVLQIATPSSVTGSLNISAGGIGGIGDVNVSGNWIWSGGTISGASKLVLESTGVLSLSGTPQLSQRTFDSHGQITATGASWQMSSAKFTNFGSLTTAGAVSSTISGSTLINNGQMSTGSARLVLATAWTNNMRISVDGSTLATSALGTNNAEFSVGPNGTVEANAGITHAVGSTFTGTGILNIKGGTHQFDASTFAFRGQVNFQGGATNVYANLPSVGKVVSGTVLFHVPIAIAELSVSTNASITFNDTVSLGSPVVVSGSMNLAGTLDRQMDTITVQSGGTLRHNGTGVTSWQSVTQSGSVLCMAPVHISGLYTLRSGTLIGSSTLEVDPTAVMEIPPSFSPTIKMQLVNRGEMSIGAGSTVNFEGGEIVNRGRLSIRGAPVYTPTTFRANAGSTGTLVNYGTAELDPTSEWNVYIPFQNDGAVEALSTSRMLVRALTNRGSIHISKGARLSLEGNTNCEPGSTISGEGELMFVSGSHIVRADTIPHTGAVTFSTSPALSVEFFKPVNLLNPVLYGSFIFHQPVTVTGNLTIYGRTELRDTINASGDIAVWDPALSSVQATLVLNQSGTLNLKRLRLGSGTLQGSANVHITEFVELARAAVFTAGSFFVDETATMHISSVTISTYFECNAPMTLIPTGASYLAAGIVFNGGTFVHNRDIVLNTNGAEIHLYAGNASGLFINNASITNTAEQTRFRSEVPVVNNGRISMVGNNAGMTFSAPLTQNGSVEAGGYSSYLAFATLTQKGSIELFDGVELSFYAGSSTTYSPSSKIIGTGTIKFTGTHSFTHAGQFQVTGPVTFESGQVDFHVPVSVNVAIIKKVARVQCAAATTLYGTASMLQGELFGNGDITLEGNWTLKEAVVWEGGTLTFAPSAVINIATGMAPSVYFARPTENLGTMNFTATLMSFYLAQDNLTNRGRINLTGAGGSIQNGSGGGLINYGTIYFDSTTSYSIRVPFVNHGEVVAHRGTADFSTNYSQGQTASLQGRWVIEANLQFSAKPTKIGGEVILMSGAASGAFLSTINSIEGTLDLRSGATATLSPAASLGTVRNRGQIKLATNAILRVTGSLLMGGSSGSSIVSEFAGPGLSGQLLVGGELRLTNFEGGTSKLHVVVPDSASPGMGDSAELFSAGESITGSFDSYVQGGALDPVTILYQQSQLIGRVVVGKPPPTPEVVATSFDVNAGQLVTVAFNTDVSSFLSISDFVLRNESTGQNVPLVSSAMTFGSGLNTVQLCFDGLLADGEYTLRVTGADILNAAGVPLPADVAVNFYILAGDANRDRVVNFDDLLIVAQNYGGTNPTFSSGDFNYDGAVDFDDLLVVAQRYTSSQLSTRAPRKVRMPLAVI